ncbi:Variant surface glycoprotein [Trypanosoma congolense IL3000]|uniref:Variant surface glycoprotein n=1 Tax=Trypanosoma congolense (strain IL3000) TaxID=1068625 RepID=F9WB91_TRYCI|nr:Variant surface glycoprotein [Trypanosoma congolense IL3000]
MKHMVKMLLASLVICCFLKDAAAQGAEVKGTDNAEQFALLCRIYNVAKNPPINHVDIQDPLKIVKEIDSMNGSFAEEKLVNETEQMGNSSGVQLSPTTTREAEVAQALLKRISQKAHNILKEIVKVNATRNIERVKTDFAQVIFGEGMNESHLCDGVLKDVGERGKACGAAGLHAKGESAGRNLVVDFFCLCAQRNNEGIYDACKVKVGSKSDKHSWGSGDPTGSSSMWASIKTECENLMHQHPKSTEEGHEVLRDFLTHLKSGGVYRWGSRSIDGSNRKAGMLGTSACKNGGDGKGPVCDGNKGNSLPGGICVYYGQESEWNDIAWLKKIKTALNAVDALNNKTTTIQRDIEKLQTLLHRAEKIYETAKVITEIQNPVVPTILQTAAKRLTAYNAAWTLPPIHHLILLFVLL